MKTSIAFRHIKASPAVKDFVAERVARLEKYGNVAQEVHVVLSVEKKRHDAEVIVSAKGFSTQARVSSQDLYVSIDGAVDKVEKAVRRRHERKVKERTHPDREALA